MFNGPAHAVKEVRGGPVVVWWPGCTRAVQPMVLQSSSLICLDLFCFLQGDRNTTETERKKKETLGSPPDSSRSGWRHGAALPGREAEDPRLSPAGGRFPPRRVSGCPLPSTQQ
jgi:hypothetical protein